MPNYERLARDHMTPEQQMALREALGLPASPSQQPMPQQPMPQQPMLQQPMPQQLLGQELQGPPVPNLFDHFKAWITSLYDNPSFGRKMVGSSARQGK